MPSEKISQTILSTIRINPLGEMQIGRIVASIRKSLHESGSGWENLGIPRKPLILKSTPLKQLPAVPIVLTEKSPPA